MDLKMKVNVLPALTYNWLHVNENNIAEDNIRIDRLKMAVPEKIPAGVTIEQEVSVSDAEKIFLKAAEAAKNAPDPVGGPNGDTYARNEAQSVHTGMGIDVDRMLDDIGVARFTTQDIVSAIQAIVFDAE